MKSSYRARHGHERYRITKKSRNAASQSRRRLALAALEEDLKVGRLRVANGISGRSEEPMSEESRKRIMKEISNIRAKM